MKKITFISLIIAVFIVGTLFITGFFEHAPSQNDRVYSGDASHTIPKGSPESTSQVEMFTLRDISSHNSADDCYLVINNKVYDVSSYIDTHPGGKREITSRCGSEVTGIFAQIHSNKAWDLLAKYKIGELAQ